MTTMPYTSPFDMRSSYSTLNKPLNGPVVASLIGHVIILFLIIFGIPYVVKNPEILYEPITVEVLSTGDLEKLEKEAAAPAQEKPEPPPLKKQAPTMEEEAPPAPEVDKFVEEVVQMPSPPPPPIETPDSKVEEEKQTRKPMPVPVRKPTPPPQAVKKKDDEKPKKSFDALLKNLAKSEDQPQPAQNSKADAAAAKSISAGQLSLGEMNAVRAQLAGCWNIQAGAKYAENLAVEISLVMSTERTVVSAKIVDQARYNRDPAFRAAADAAMRAVRNPRCSPLNLPPAKYSEWKTLILNFDPKDML